jgi:hypothetical protein
VLHSGTRSPSATHGIPDKTNIFPGPESSLNILPLRARGGGLFLQKYVRELSPRIRCAVLTTSAVAA